MRKFIIFLLVLAFLLTGCNGDIYTDGGKGEETSGGDGKTGEKNYVPLELAQKGDFNDFTAGNALSGNNWGASDNVKIVSNGKEGNGVEMSGKGFLFYNTLSTFKSSFVTATADVKLSDVSQAEKVELLVEFCDGSNQPYEGGSFSVKAAQDTEWQILTVTVPLESVKKFDANQVTVKVVKSADDGDSSTILVDNVKMTVKDRTAVNFLPYGTFIAGNLNGKWKTVDNTVTPSSWTDSTVKTEDGKKAVELPYGGYELISSNWWIANGNCGPQYDTTLDGILTFSAKGEGTVTVYVEKKNSDSDCVVPCKDVAITDEWATYSVAVDKADKAYKETTLKFKTSSGVGNVYITDVFLHYTEGK